ncbi:MAG: hypothetical protein PHO60_07960 [Methanothrix sp.]|jgi:hypothetical protein|nr:hypothetical protein [Methanothrix sp.]
MFPTPKTISGLLKAAGTFDGGEKIAKDRAEKSRLITGSWTKK